MVKISKNYIPNLKEKYMCEKHKAYFKKKLTEWKSEIIKLIKDGEYICVLTGVKRHKLV